jgi:hypothetical protein
MRKNKHIKLRGEGEERRETVTKGKMDWKGKNIEESHHQNGFPNSSQQCLMHFYGTDGGNCISQKRNREN